MNQALPIVIIGTGLAGYSLAREFRKLNDSRPILMLTRDDGHSYSKPMLSIGLTKGKSAEDLSMAGPGKMAEKLKASIRSFTEVSYINAQKKQLHFGSDESSIEIVHYEKLVLANGASTNHLSFPGSEHPNILSINDLMDYRQFRQNLNGKRRVLIMGAGLIGCEYANDLLNGHYDVTVVAPSRTALNGLIPAFAGDALIQGLTQAGVKFLLQRTVKEVVEESSQLLAILSDGTHIETDLIISAVGLKPNIKLASAAGIECNQGVVTNRYLETSCPDIYALGDCAEIDNHVLLYVLPLMASARALAKTLNGDRTQVSFTAMPVMTKTPACPVVTCPPRIQSGKWLVEQDGINIKATYVSTNNEVLGFVLTGSCISEKQSLAKQVKGIHL